MKTDKILFAAACFAMGALSYSAYNRPNNTDEILQQNKHTTFLTDTVPKRQNLSKDTFVLSNTLKTDTLKLIKKAK